MSATSLVPSWPYLNILINRLCLYKIIVDKSSSWFGY